MRRWLLVLGLPFLATACDQEVPTSIGDGLLPPDAIRTFEVVIEPHRYLVWDTAFGGYTDAASANFLMVAQEFEGPLNVHTLARFNIPTTVTVLDPGGTTQTDTTPTYAGGQLRLFVDTLQSTTGTVRLALYRTAEEWHQTATWSSRVDTLGGSEPWAQPGGTRGAFVDTASYVAGQDTVMFRVDPATIVEWADSANPGRGALIVMETAGGRLRMGFPELHVDLTTDVQPDTVVNSPAFLSAATFVFDPIQTGIADAPRIGGTPAWRTMMRLQERMDTLTVPCPDVADCRLRLDEVTINYAAIELQPVQPPAGSRPEGPLNVGAFLLLPSELAPIQRWPVGVAISVTTIPETRFEAPGAPLVPIPITQYLRLLTRPSDPDEVPSRHLTFAAFDQHSFGFGSFAALPSLRLVLSIAKELQLP